MPERKNNILSTSREVGISIGLFVTSLVGGIPFMDFGNSIDVLRVLGGIKTSCELQHFDNDPQALVLMSAGWDDRNNKELNQHEKWRVEALVYEYLNLLEAGIPPKLIIIAAKAGEMHHFKIRNSIQMEFSKIVKNGEIPNELFEIVYADHTDSSIAAVQEVINQHGIEGQIMFVTSDPHFNRARYNVCRRLGTDGAVINARDIIEPRDRQRALQMQRSQSTTSYKRSVLLENLKTASWIWRPRQFYSK